MDIPAIHQLFLQCHSVSIDTRKIDRESLFVAIKGDRFDANTFAAEALQKGASFVIIDNPDYFVDERTILVDDALTTLQALSKFHRQFLKLPIIALTGSNGKTTTKELLNAVLSQKFNTKATVGNLNNHIGVPLTLLSFNAQTEIGIVEMGANHQKEIAFLCEIAAPDYGFITNFGKAHLEGFGGVSGVIKGKSEMYEYLLSNNKKVFVNLEDRIQAEKTAQMHRITFGQNEIKANVNISKVMADPFVVIELAGMVIKSRLIGLYNANNIMAAITIGKYFGVSNEAIKLAIEEYISDNNRSQLVYKDSNEIILDAYNANPSSMKVAIENFLQLKHQNKVIVLGDMFELGTESTKEHKEIVGLLLKEDQINCHFIGNEFYHHKTEKDHFKFYRTFQDFEMSLQKQPLTNSMILIKGSRGMALERTVGLL